ncbi:MAG: GIY-YIG nuclease family protein [Lachnospiraceae bacterium]|nr:GIY-YIG nuclease family protein [Lachnospiraceae bacterium]MCI8877257.1 GIY-YIG nuclease family protein [Lachnospiraceae bacterium]
MARGKSLKIFMMDGDAAGRWICTLAGRTTKAYRIPRSLCKKCGDIDELKRPAVYLLFGDEDDSGRPIVYVGETEDAYTRLRDHEDKKDYWSEAIVFVSQDDHFNKAHVKYLEGRLYEIVTQVDRYTIRNTQKPASAAIAMDEQAEMEDFIDNVTVLTFGMGHKVFEPLLKKDIISNDLSDKQVFYIRNKANTVDAKMVRTIEGYVVLKGSKIRTSNTKSTPSWVKKKRAQLIADGTIKDGIFTRNELFSSPSGASDLVTGNSTSGNKMWKTETGVTLGEIIEKEKQN